MEVGSGEPITGVQSIAQNGATVVPPEYVQPIHTRPQLKPTPGPQNLPLIDLSCSDEGKGAGAGGGVPLVHEQIGRACSEWGAFHVIDHGVDAKLLHQMRRVGRSFFEECSVEEKLKYSCDPNSPASQGYGSRMLVASNDTVLDWRDYFDHHTLPLSRRHPPRWPHFPPNYRRVVAEYSDEMKVLAQKLLGLISESSGLPTLCVEEAVGEVYQNITISYYPPCPQPELTLGLQSHSDMGAITLLIQDDVGGLQVLKDGEWVTVEPLDDAIFVILGDQTEVITNGKYRSAVHRAITNSSRARVSVATFHDPAKTRQIFPALDPPKYRPVVYGDYVKSWYTKGPEGKRNIDALLLF